MAHLQPQVTSDNSFQPNPRDKSAQGSCTHIAWHHPSAQRPHCTPSITGPAPWLCPLGPAPWLCPSEGEHDLSHYTACPHTPFPLSGASSAPKTQGHSGEPEYPRRHREPAHTRGAPVALRGSPLPSTIHKRNNLICIHPLLHYRTAEIRETSTRSWARPCWYPAPGPAE